MIYVAFLTALAITVTPGVGIEVKGSMAGLVAVGFGMLNPSPYYQDHLEFPGGLFLFQGSPDNAGDNVPQLKSGQMLRHPSTRGRL